jgi:mRNA interferase MazF
MISKTPLKITRGDVWLVNFNPTVGDEIQKVRPAVVMSINAPFRHRLQLVAPITSWQEKFVEDFWMVFIPSSSSNGLQKNSAANAFQLKSVSEERFIKQLGVIAQSQVEEIAIAVALCIGYSSST